MAEETATDPKRAAAGRQAVPEAWKDFLRSHAAITRQMDADLIASQSSS